MKEDGNGCLNILSTYERYLVCACSHVCMIILFGVNLISLDFDLHISDPLLCRTYPPLPASYPRTSLILIAGIPMLNHPLLYFQFVYCNMCTARVLWPHEDLRSHMTPPTMFSFVFALLRFYDPHYTLLRFYDPHYNHFFKHQASLVYFFLYYNHLVKPRPLLNPSFSITYI